VPARLVADRQGHYVDGDAAALELLGVTLEELRLLRVGDLSGPHAEMARTVWRRMAATGEDMSSGEGPLFLPNGTEIRVKYVRIRALPNGDYELELEQIDASQLDRPPMSDRPSTILRQWRVAEREAEAAANEGPGAMGAPDEPIDAADKLRRLYQDSMLGRTEAGSET